MKKDPTEALVFSALFSCFFLTACMFHYVISIKYLSFILTICSIICLEIMLPSKKKRQ